ncbi:MAG: metal-sulfur cluster assembly factor [Candidatus Marinimicrobia bacterium]|nr:metal-sulfur cluster assembly factor [Candidatus Neomarinimicrobiota bacterium]
MELAGVTKEQVYAALKEVNDPELPISLVDLGLIYGVEVDNGNVDITMTLTASGCPAIDMIKEDILEKLAGTKGVDSVNIEVVWSPAWTKEMLTDDGVYALKALGIAV